VERTTLKESLWNEDGSGPVRTRRAPHSGSHRVRTVRLRAGRARSFDAAASEVPT
jgi:hypothetical protein